MRRRTCAFTVIAALFLGADPGLSLAQAPAAPPPQTSVPNVTVVAPKLKQVPQVIEDFSRPFSGDRRLSRWRQPICPRVIGFSPEQDAFIAARILQIAKAAKLATPAEHCDPNIFILASSNDVADRRKIGKRASGVLTDSRWPVDLNQLSDFTRDDGAPVHTFYVSGAVPDHAGARAVDEYTTDNAVGSPADPTGVLQAFNAPVVQTSAYRLNADSDQAFIRDLIVIDGRQLKGIKPAALAAYLAMTTLAEIRVARPMMEVSTIVNLFADAKARVQTPDDLTFWDRAYLGALYRAPTEASASTQKNEIAQRIRHAIQVLEVAPAAEPAPSGGENH